NQPQYYYLLIILPFYEFLPIVGSVLAMFAGLTRFWRYRRERLEVRQKEKRKRDQVENGTLPTTLLEDGNPVADSDYADSEPPLEAFLEPDSEAETDPPRWHDSGWLSHVPF